MKSLVFDQLIKGKRKNIFHGTLFTNPKTKPQLELLPFQTFKNQLPNN